MKEENKDNDKTTEDSIENIDEIVKKYTGDNTEKEDVGSDEDSDDGSDNDSKEELEDENASGESEDKNELGQSENEKESDGSEDLEDPKDDTENEDKEGVEIPRKKLTLKKFIRSFLELIEWILLFVVVGLLVYIFTSTFRGRAANLFGYSILHVVTGSMEPTISVDDYVLVEDISVKDLKEEDIIAYYSEARDIKGLMVIHRIVEVNDDGTFVTKGDANKVPDELSVRPDQVIGRYSNRIWLLNWLASFVSLRKLLLLLVIIPMFLISIYEARTVTKLVRKNKKPEETEEEKAARIEMLKREAIKEYLEQCHSEQGEESSENKE